MKKIILTNLIMLLIATQAFSQKTISGIVHDAANNEGIPYATISEKGNSNSTVADGSGNFLITTTSNTLLIKASGYSTKEFEITETNFALNKNVNAIGGIQIVGSRNTARTKLNSIAPVDVINIREVTNKNGQLDVNQLLQYVAPSFNSNRQSGSDGADHIDPASLRGMGPDQTLVLLNGKRYHQSSLVNIFGSRGRGNNGTDLNTIPASAIERIEILRDGAAAQYGSDAIAGVINIVLKNVTDNISIAVAEGAYNTMYNRYNKAWDGNNFDVNANYGFKVAKKGFVNLTLDYNNRQHTNRAATNPDSVLARREFGDPKANNTSLFLNSALPVSAKSEIYVFGGINKRYGEAYAWTRWPNSSRNNLAIYPNGFDPIITSNILDYSGTVGFRTKFGDDWNLDLSATTGKNNFHYGVNNTLNRSLGNSSPTSFDAGGFGLTQTTFNADAHKNYSTILNGLHLAFGAEYRMEMYNIFAGEEKSYKQYDTNYAPGSQGFPGFQPSDVVNKSRNSQAIYTDIELKVNKAWDIEGALRFENYSDFGSALTWKLATRYELMPGVAFRACANTGFRAPSLPQKYFNSTFTNFIAGKAVDVLIARNDGAVATALGIPSLTKETSTNFSIGEVISPSKNFNISIDAYWIYVKNRIVLTGQFMDSDTTIGSLLQALNVGQAQFFTNAVNTTTRGLDIVATYTKLLNNSKLNFMLAANFNRIDIDKVYTNAKLAGKESTYFDLREQYFLKASAPPSKISFATDYIYKKLTSTLRLTRFDKIQLANWNYDVNNLDVYDARITTDLSFTYKATNSLQFTLGSANLFNVYPTKHNPQGTESGGAWDPCQMGFNGRFLFAKMRWNLNTKKNKI